MRFSDWQLNRLRDALGAYHDYGRGSDGDYFNWKDVSAAIEESTGVEIPQERLRQFVEGVNKPDGGRKFPVPQDAWLDAIVKFATDEDSELMTEAELREHEPARHAASRLLEYLDQAFDTARVPPPLTLEGTYQCRRSEENQMKVSELTLQRASAEGLIQVVQTENFYAMSQLQFDRRSPKEREKACTSRTKFGGWAILTPEDNLFLFLKNDRSGRNRYYFTLATDLSHAAQTPVTALVFLHHDYPLGSNENDLRQPHLPPDFLVTVLQENIIYFRRIP